MKNASSDPFECRPKLARLYFEISDDRQSASPVFWLLNEILDFSGIAGVHAIARLAAAMAL